MKNGLCTKHLFLFSGILLISFLLGCNKNDSAKFLQKQKAEAERIQHRSSISEDIGLENIKSEDPAKYLTSRFSKDILKRSKSIDTVNVTVTSKLISIIIPFNTYYFDHHPLLTDYYLKQSRLESNSDQIMTDLGGILHVLYDSEIVENRDLKIELVAFKEMENKWGDSYKKPIQVLRTSFGNKTLLKILDKTFKEGKPVKVLALAKSYWVNSIYLSKE